MLLFDSKFDDVAICMQLLTKQQAVSHAKARLMNV